MAEITKKDALAWLDMQRDAVNTEIIYAVQSGQAQYHKHLKIINWLAELVKRDDGEMTAVEYLKAKQDMCISHTCDKCPLASSAYEDSCRCTEMYKQDKAIRIVKKWKEEQDGH